MFSLSATPPNEPKRGNKMTRKDFELIAKALADFSPADGVFVERDLIARDIADAIEAQHPRFDRFRFLVAAGVYQVKDGTITATHKDRR
jgi:hypothetical protein